MELATYVDSLWIVIAGILVMFMQPGFMLVETGFTRSKNSVNIVMKNFMDFSVGAVSYWAFGFALAYGGTTVGGFLAYGNFFLEGDSITYFFQVVFAATAATIVSGAVAERTKFSAYLLFQPFICGVIYPIVTHWVWSGQGWLGDLGFIDFAGSGVVHMVGGFAALAGVQIVGPRIGKYDDDGNPQVIPGSSMVAGALGVFILWFGWYGFNVGSALAAVDVNLAAIAVTTTLSAASGSITAMYTSMISGKPNVGMTLNGALAGLVGITAGCANVNNLGAVLGAFIIWFMWVQSSPMGLWVVEMISNNVQDGNAWVEFLEDRVFYLRLIFMGAILLIIMRFYPSGILPEKNKEL